MKTKFFIYSCFLTLMVISCGKESVNCLAIDNPDCICTMEYAPVCGCDDITYSNECAANCADVEIVSNGTCPE